VSERKMIQQAFKFALDPTPAQRRRFTSHAGAARYAYNWGITVIAEARKEWAAEKAAGVDKPTTEIPNHFGLCKRWTAYKDDPASGLHWVAENYSGTYQAALRDAAAAWKAHTDSRNGRRKGRTVGRPRYKSRHHSSPAFQVHGTGLQVADQRHIKLPKIGLVRTHEKTKKLQRLLRRGTAACVACGGYGRQFIAASDGSIEVTSCGSCKGAGTVTHTRIVRGTVSCTPAGRWFISLTVETLREHRIHRDGTPKPSARQRRGGTVGIDWGVRDIATLSTGEVFANPRYLAAALHKLRRAQQDLARKADGSKKRGKARLRVAKLHGRVAALREDALEKWTTHLVHGHATIAVEGWDVRDAMHRGSTDIPRKARRTRNRALADTGIGMARWMIEHKAAWYGARVVITGHHEPTGRTCSACGQVRDKPVPPADETFSCPSCGHTSDRRINTARVLARTARNDAQSSGESKNARGGDVRPGAPRRDGRSPAKREARPRSDGRGKTGTPDP
jgi:putative transposase